jgi:curli biogenesis system outer membrane secretion channel CsgG
MVSKAMQMLVLFGVASLLVGQNQATSNKKNPAKLEEHEMRNNPCLPKVAPIFADAQIPKELMDLVEKSRAASKEAGLPEGEFEKKFEQELKGKSLPACQDLKSHLVSSLKKTGCFEFIERLVFTPNFRQALKDQNTDVVNALDATMVCAVAVYEEIEPATIVTSENEENGPNSSRLIMDTN